MCSSYAAMSDLKLRHGKQTFCWSYSWADPSVDVSIAVARSNCPVESYVLLQSSLGFLYKSGDPLATFFDKFAAIAHIVDGLLIKQL